MRKIVLISVGILLFLVIGLFGFTLFQIYYHPANPTRYPGFSNSYPSTTPITTPLPVMNPVYPNFKGFIQFTGNQHPENVSNPYLVGASLDFYWSEIEPVRGEYRWDVIEQVMKPWIDNGKKVVIRITTSGNCYPSQNPLSCHRTPNWVFAEGVRKLSDPEGSIHPAFWDNAFLTEYKTFIQAFAQKYDGDPRLIAVNSGDGNDGELRVDRTGNWTTSVQKAWEAIGYSEPIWQNTLLQIIGTYAASFKQTPIAMQTGQPFLKHKSEEEDSFLQEVHSLYPNLWFQDDALRVGEATHGPIWSQVTHIEEPGKPLAQSGDTLDADIQQGLAMGANYIYIFATDLTPSNQTTLEKYVK